MIIDLSKYYFIQLIENYLGRPNDGKAKYIMEFYSLENTTKARNLEIKNI